MKSEAVSPPVIAGVSLDDGWRGVCERLMVIVRGSSFKDAKNHTEANLMEHIERILREQLEGGPAGFLASIVLVWLAVPVRAPEG
jgi:hypothetical protein